MTIRAAASSLRGYWRARLLRRFCVEQAGASFSHQPIFFIRCNGRGLNLSPRLQAREVFHNSLGGESYL